MCIPACVQYMSLGFWLMVLDVLFGLYIYKYVYQNKKKKKMLKYYALAFAALLIIGFYLFTGCDVVNYLSCKLGGLCAECS